MAQKTRLQITQLAETKFPTNNAKQITATDLRDFQADVNDSFFNLIDDAAEDVKFSDAGFSATNVKDAILEVKNFAGDRPLFYADVYLALDETGWSGTLSATNYTGLSVSAVEVGAANGSNGNVRITFTFPDTNANFGTLVRKNAGLYSVTATTAIMDVGLNASVSPYRVTFYPEYVAADYVVND